MPGRTPEDRRARGEPRHRPDSVGPMNAEAAGRMPAITTLDDLAATTSADGHGDRYETGLQHVLSVVPPPDSERTVIATQLMAWLIAAGVSLDQILRGAGIRIPGQGGDGGRSTDLTLWSRPQPGTGWLATADLLLAIDIVPAGPDAIDRATALTDYATAGIAHCWTVAQNETRSTTQHRLGPDGVYQVAGQMPLEWLLQMPLAWVL
jgi:hypothetical protein